MRLRAGTVFLARLRTDCVSGFSFFLSPSLHPSIHPSIPHALSVFFFLFSALLSEALVDGWQPNSTLLSLTLVNFFCRWALSLVPAEQMLPHSLRSTTPSFTSFLLNISTPLCFL